MERVASIVGQIRCSVLCTAMTYTALVIFVLLSTMLLSRSGRQGRRVTAHRHFLEESKQTTAVVLHVPLGRRGRALHPFQSPISSRHAPRFALSAGPRCSTYTENTLTQQQQQQQALCQVGFICMGKGWETCTTEPPVVCTSLLLPGYLQHAG